MAKKPRQTGHMLDRRRRAANAAAVAAKPKMSSPIRTPTPLAVSLATMKHDLIREKIRSIENPIGILLDDDRSFGEVKFACEMTVTENVEWIIVRNFPDACLVVDTIAELGKTISYMTLDWDLGEMYHEVNRNGEYFLDWFTAKMETLYEEKGQLIVGPDDFTVYVHSGAHPDQIFNFRKKAYSAERWFRNLNLNLKKDIASDG